ncbi:hypothetical protein ACIRS1_37530 [Kitasatospora sp. NPDC101176]|uniref:hypothetical protein n=1 Tax=Kitasatospora sp. NPDC101176 TaxID=3364099 RepID=UPI0037F17F3B
MIDLTVRPSSFGRRGWHVLTDALDNPDGDELLAVERAEADRARRAREAAERERLRPACRRSSAPFSNERWEEKEQGWNDDGLYAGCRQADADRKAREAARPRPPCPRPPSRSAPGGRRPRPGRAAARAAGSGQAST